MLSNEIQKGQNNMCVVAGNAPSLAEIDYNRLPLTMMYFVVINSILKLILSG